MQIIDPTVQYSFLAAFQPSAFISVDATYDLTLTTESSDLHALLFYITTSTHDSSKWNICTTYQSGNYCLDQFGNNATQAVLQQAGYYSGQQWSLTGNDQSDGSTFWRLQSDFAGPSRYLATDGENVVMISNAPIDATYWKIISGGSSSSSTSVSSSLSTAKATVLGNSSTLGSTSSANAPVSTTLPTSTSNPSSNVTKESGSTSLTTGTIIGIALGAAAIIIVAIFIVGFFFFRRRKLKKAQLALSAPPPIYEAESSPLYLKRKPVPQPQIAEVSAYSRRGDGHPWQSAPPPALARYEMDGQHNIHELGPGRTS